MEENLVRNSFSLARSSSSIVNVCARSKTAVMTSMSIFFGRALFNRLYGGVIVVTRHSRFA